MSRAVLLLPALMGGLFFFTSSARAEFDCLTCHEVMEGENVHEPAAMDCLTCHYEHKGDPAPARKFRGAENVTELCLSCHEKTMLRLEGGHPAQNHPYWIERDPMWDRGDPDEKTPEFNCTSCHNPHSSNQPALFRWRYNKAPQDGNLCATCHRDIAFGYWTPPKPDYRSPRLPDPTKRQQRTPTQPQKPRHWWEYIISYEP